MFGAWQVGAWQALEPHFKPDLIVGASIGAINGWLIAAQHPAAKIAELWREAGDGPRAGWRIPPGLFGGFIDPSPIEASFRSLYDSYRPRTRFAVVCTEFPALRPRIFTGAEVTWRHLMASCAVPVVFPAYRLPDDRHYVDGGFLGPLPLWAAVELGATRIVAIHVLPPMPPALDHFIRIMRLVANHRPDVPKDVEVRTVGPPRVLGGPRDASVWDAGNVECWLAEGRETAERALSAWS